MGSSENPICMLRAINRPGLFLGPKNIANHDAVAIVAIRRDSSQHLSRFVATFVVIRREIRRASSRLNKRFRLPPPHFLFFQIPFLLPLTHFPYSFFPLSFFSSLSSPLPYFLFLLYVFTFFLFHVFFL